ncbi:MAG TPA: hypothetical protein VFI76_03645 [Terrimicrobiaceae bacterium]|nr:hypothetical protein [Terrimicrobiaceae bacterium]
MKDTRLSGHVVVALFAGCFLSAPRLVADSLLSELSGSQRSQMKGGEQVVVVENIEGKAWPRVKIYRFINANPEQVAAVFFDFENAKSFVPNVFKSEISNRVSPCTMDVDYGLDVPIFPDEYYTVRNSLRPVDDKSYFFEWKLLRAVLTKDSVGSFRVEPWEDKSLVCYQNLVTPGSNIAVLLRGKAIEQMKETTKALAAQIEKEKTTNAAGLKRQIAAMRTALKEEPTQLTKY